MKGERRNYYQPVTNSRSLSSIEKGIINNMILIIRKNGLQALRELVTGCDQIPKMATLAVLKHFKAATAMLISEILGLSKMTILRHLKDLEDQGLAVRVEKAAKAIGARGPKSRIWAVPGYSEEDIHRVHKMEIMRTTEFLYPVIEGYRLCWSKGLIKEDEERRWIHLREIIALVKRYGLASRFAAYDIACEISQLLRLDGVEVWE